MNKYIYNILTTYYRDCTASNHIQDIDFTYKTINNLYNRGKITKEERESIFEDVTKTLDTALKIISDCPFINISINNSDNTLPPNNIS